MESGHFVPWPIRSILWSLWFTSFPGIVTSFQVLTKRVKLQSYKTSERYTPPSCDEGHFETEEAPVVCVGSGTNGNSYTFIITTSLNIVTRRLVAVFVGCVSHVILLAKTWPKEICPKCIENTVQRFSTSWKLFPMRCNYLECAGNGRQRIQNLVEQCIRKLEIVFNVTQ